MAIRNPNQSKCLREAREARRRQEVRQAIIQAAERVMTRHGYTALTMDDVAKEAELSKATVYNYFSSKGNLVVELFLDYLYRFYRNIIRIRSQPGPTTEKLREIIAYFLRLHREKESLSRILMLDKAFLQKMKFFVGEASSSSRQERELMAEIKNQREKIVNEVILILEEGVAKGELRPMAADMAVRLIEALLQGFIHSRFWNPSRLSLEKETNLLLDFVLWGIGLKTDQAKGACS